MWMRAKIAAAQALLFAIYSVAVGDNLVALFIAVGCGVKPLADVCALKARGVRSR